MKNIYRNITLENDISYDSLRLVSGTLDLNGYTLTVKNDLIQSGGNIRINGGNLVVKGDYRIQSVNNENNRTTYGDSSGILIMTNENDLVKVCGSFATQSSYSHRDYLTAGVMELKKDFCQKYNKSYSDSKYNFYAKDTHKVILNGQEEQKVSFDYPTYSTFNELELNNSSGQGFEFQTSIGFRDINIKRGKFSCITSTNNINLNTDREIPGSLNIQTGKLNLNGCKLTIKGDLFINGGAIDFKGGIIIAEKNLIQSGGNIDFKGGTLEVEKDLIQGGGNIQVNNGNLVVNGDYRIQSVNKENDRTTYDDSSGILIMTNESDSVKVHGSFVTQSSYSHRDYLTAGVMELKKDFYQKYNKSYSDSKYNFYAKDKHKVILNGEREQSVSFDNPTNSTFNELELNNSSDEGFKFITKIRFNDFQDNGNKYDEIKCIGNWTLKENRVITGGLYLVNGTFNLNGYTLTVEKDLIQSGGYININGGILSVENDLIQLGGNIEVNGGKLDVNGDYRIQSRKVEPIYLKEGDNGYKVKILQRDLISLEYYPNEINGNYDSITKKSVQNFQKSINYTSDGKVCIPTIEAVTTKLIEQNHAFAYKDSSSIPTFDKVKDSQGKLKELGYYDGDITGQYDCSTKDSVKTFQEKCMSMYEDYYDASNRIGILDETTIIVIDDKYNKRNEPQEPITPVTFNKEYAEKLLAEAKDYYGEEPYADHKEKYDDSTNSIVKVQLKKISINDTTLTLWKSSSQVCTDGIGEIKSCWHQGGVAKSEYVNAEIVPYIVQPGNNNNDVYGGDLGVVIDTVTGKSTYVIYAEVGPEDEIGEMSLAAFKALELECYRPKDYKDYCQAWGNIHDSKREDDKGNIINPCECTNVFFGTGDQRFITIMFPDSGKEFGYDKYNKIPTTAEEIKRSAEEYINKYFNKGGDINQNPDNDIENTNAWEPVHPPIKNGKTERSTEKYNSVINQFKVETNARYARRDGNTYCNIFVWDVTSAMGVEIPHWVDKNNGSHATFPNINDAYETTANGNEDWLKNYGSTYGWEEVTASVAQEKADMGYPSVAVWNNTSGIGHIAMVRPSKLGEAVYQESDGTYRNVFISQAGGTNFNYEELIKGFGRNPMKDIKFYINA